MNGAETLRRAIASLEQVENCSGFDVAKSKATAEKIKQECVAESVRKDGWVFRDPNYHFTL